MQTNQTLELFSAPWCSGCQSVKAILDSEGAAYNVINIDEKPLLVKEFNIRSIPVLMKMQDGKEVDRLVGSQSKAKVKSFIGGSDV